MILISKWFPIIFFIIRFAEIITRKLISAFYKIDVSLYETAIAKIKVASNTIAISFLSVVIFIVKERNYFL